MNQQMQLTYQIVDTLTCSLDKLVHSCVMNSRAYFHTTPSLELLSNYVYGKFDNTILHFETYPYLKRKI